MTEFIDLQAIMALASSEESACISEAFYRFVPQLTIDETQPFDVYILPSSVPEHIRTRPDKIERDEEVFCAAWFAIRNIKVRIGAPTIRIQASLECDKK